MSRIWAIEGRIEQEAQSLETEVVGDGRHMEGTWNVLPPLTLGRGRDHGRLDFWGTSEARGPRYGGPPPGDAECSRAIGAKGETKGGTVRRGVSRGLWSGRGCNKERLVCLGQLSRHLCVSSAALCESLGQSSITGSAPPPPNSSNQERGWVLR